MSEQKEQLIKEWLDELQIMHAGHNLAAAKYEKHNKRIGIPVVALSAIVGSSIFTTLQQSPDEKTKMMIGSLSIIAAVLAGLQTFLKFSELSEKHKTTAVRYGEIKRELQQLILNESKPAEELDALLQSIRGRWNTLDEQAPNLPAALFKKASLDYS